MDHETDSGEMLALQAELLARESQESRDQEPREPR
jgi:hypothetical protein